MILALLLSLSSGAVQQAPAATPQLDSKVIRVHVQTDDGGDPTELAARRESVKHISAAMGDRKKAGWVVAGSEADADIVVEVTGRGVTVPKVVIGLSGGMGASGGRPGPPATPVRVAKLDVIVALVHGSASAEFSNKNRPNETESGWKSAAGDIAKQLEKWISDNRAAIIEARRRR